jgi:hypothetical protein
MDEVQCVGTEASIFDCPHKTTDNCGGSEGLGVICSTVALVGGSRPQEGNIMVNGEPVCDDGSTTYRAATARVVCRELGYNGESQHTTSSYFGQVSSDFGMDDVQCTGNEASIFDCPHQTTDNCGGTEGLGVICSTDPSEDCICGLSKRGTRIVGGQEVTVDEWPWQGAMVWTNGISVFCGATVISDEWILTASQCLDGKSAAEIEVLLGEHDYTDNDEPVRMAISEIIQHEGWNTATLDQDFALLRMAYKIDWASNPNIRPVCLPDANAGDFDQLAATVTGWGTTSLGGSISDVLMEADVQVMSNSICSNAYGDYSGAITENMICAADASGNGGSDACQGDSGGPLVSCGGDWNCGTTQGQNYDLIGVVSWGIGCAHADYPGVYARVTAARAWIDANAPGMTVCPRTSQGPSKGSNSTQLEIKTEE